MKWWMMISPVLTAFLGLIITWAAIRIYLYRVLPKRQAAIGAAVGKMVSELFSFSSIEQKLTDEKSIEKIMPEAETQVDHFLRTKLKTAFPIIGSFIGDKTITQLKDVFMQELRQILPVILKKYINNLEKDLDLAEMVGSQLSSLSPTRTVAIINKLTGNFRGLYVLGALTGLVAGVFELFLMLYV